LNLKKASRRKENIDKGACQDYNGEERGDRIMMLYVSHYPEHCRECMFCRDENNERWQGDNKGEWRCMLTNVYLDIDTRNHDTGDFIPDWRECDCPLMAL